MLSSGLVLVFLPISSAAVSCDFEYFSASFLPSKLPSAEYFHHRKLYSSFLQLQHGMASMALLRDPPITQNPDPIQVHGKTPTDFSGAGTAPSSLLKIKHRLSPSPIPPVCFLKCERLNSAPKGRAEVGRLGAGAVSAQRGSLRPQSPQTPP